MKISDKNKPVDTIPNGVWESSKPKTDKDKKSITTDLQENGYPVNKQSK